MKVLVFGASGMLGGAMMQVLGEGDGIEVFGTLRDAGKRAEFPPAYAARLLTGIDAANQDALVYALSRVQPDVVVNCIGVVKQLQQADDPLVAIPVNAELPHRLARLCALAEARLVHISTDCVFSGSRGGYLESDEADATDLYGRSKFLGELHDAHCVTLRTSIIGHERGSRRGLLEWFLAQQGQCKGYTRAIFSGLPAVVLAEIVRDVIIPRADLGGLYQVASEPISKFELLRLVAEVYGKAIDIVPDDSLVIDRSLDGSRFRAASGYHVQKWPELVKVMHSYYRSSAKQGHVQG